MRVTLTQFTPHLHLSRKGREKCCGCFYKLVLVVTTIDAILGSGGTNRLWESPGIRYRMRRQFAHPSLAFMSFR